MRGLEQKSGMSDIFKGPELYRLDRKRGGRKRGNQSGGQCSKLRIDGGLKSGRSTVMPRKERVVRFESYFESRADRIC